MADTLTDNIYKTSDTPLAAYLRTEGFTLLDIEYVERNNRTIGVYIFQNDSEQLGKCVHDFELGKAISNVVQYEENRRRLLRVVQNRLPWFNDRAEGSK